MTIVVTKLDADGTPSDQDCPECGSENSVVRGDTGFWKCASCSTIFCDWTEIQTKCGQSFRFPAKTEAQGDNLYVESLGGIVRLPDSCRELGDSYWSRLNEKQLLIWVEVITSSLQAAYARDREKGSRGEKVLSHSSLQRDPYYILSEAMESSDEADDTFDILEDVNHFFWDGLTWNDLKRLAIWAMGRLLDKELIKEAKARVASPDF